MPTNVQKCRRRNKVHVAMVTNLSYPERECLHTTKHQPAVERREPSAFRILNEFDPPCNFFICAGNDPGDHIGVPGQKLGGGVPIAAPCDRFITHRHNRA